MTSICRACAKSGGFRNLLTNENTMKAFFNLTGIAIKDDGLSKCLCSECFELLNKFTQFRNEIIKNNSLFKSNQLKSNHFFVLKSIEFPEAITILQDKQTEESVLPIQTILNKEECSLNEIDDTYANVIEDTFTNKIDDTYANEIEDTFANENDSDVEIVELKCEEERKKTIKENKSTSKVKRSRNFINLDPTKITTLVLSIDEQLKRHRALAESDDYKNMAYKCEKCYKGFNYEGKLRRHIEKDHRVNWEFECDICSRTMINAGSLTLHKRKHSVVYQCNICRANYAKKIRAVSHYQNIHEGISRKYPCERCGKVFNKDSTLYAHIRNYHNASTSERPKCTECSKTFMTTIGLNNHMVIHTGEKNYSCEICGAKFRMRGNVKDHMYSHSVVKTFFCPCGSSFKGEYSYRHHLMTSASHVTDEVKAKNTCETCGKQFPTCQGLKKHKLSHEPKRTPSIRFICHYCGRGFSFRRSLEHHIARTHISETQTQTKTKTKDKNIGQGKTRTNSKKI